MHDHSGGWSPVPRARMGLEPLHGGAQVSTCIAGPTLVADAPAQLADLLRIEVIDSDRDAGAPQAGHQLSRLLDRLGRS